MTAREIIDEIETTYQNSDLIYEMVFSRFMNLSGFGFHLITLKKGSSIIRARYSNNTPAFKHLSDVSYPKPEHVRNFSRLNRPKQNLFYASQTEQACLSEMVPFWIDEFKNGDIINVTLGRWILKNDMKLIIIPDPKNNNEFNEKVTNQMQPAEIEFWNYISDKFKKSTKQDKNIYEFTSAFGNALWLNTRTQKIKAEGFIYSSVQSPTDLNIALCPSKIIPKEINPVEFVEICFQRGGLSAKGLPTYFEINERKKGIIDLKEERINWI